MMNATDPQELARTLGSRPLLDDASTQMERLRTVRTKVLDAIDAARHALATPQGADITDACEDAIGGLDDVVSDLDHYINPLDEATAIAESRQSEDPHRMRRSWWAS